MVKDLDYAYAVSRIKANERYMLSASDFENVIETQSFNDAVNVLKTKKWIQKDFVSANEVIEDAEKKLWSLLLESLPDKSVLDFFTIQNDFFNIKAALKCNFLNSNFEEYLIYPTSIDIKKLSLAVSNCDSSYLKEEYRKPFKKAFDALNQTESGQVADIILDKAALELMIDYSKKANCILLEQIAEFIVASCNIKTVLKIIKTNQGSDFAKNILLPCKSIDKDKLVSLCDTDVQKLAKYLEKTDYKKAAEFILQDEYLFEKWCENEIFALGAKSDYEFFGFAPICGYYYKKMYEIKKVKTILYGKEKNLSSNEIRERLNVLYV